MKFHGIWLPENIRWDSKLVRSVLNNGDMVFNVKDKICLDLTDDLIFLFDLLNTQAEWRKMPEVADPIWDRIEAIDKYVEETKNR